MPTEVDQPVLPDSQLRNPEVTVQDAIEAAEVLAQKTTPEAIEDEQGNGRTEFHIAGVDDVSLVFRDREELPTFDETSGQVVKVISPEEKPWRTSGEDYVSWLSKMSDGQPFSHPFERALTEGAGEVQLIANGTPYGIVRTARSLIETGLSEDGSDRLAHLTELEKKITEEEYDDDVYQFFDQLYAASAVTVENGSMQPSDVSEANDQGLMEVTLALVGDEEAKKVVEGKVAFVQQLDRKHDQEVKERVGLAAEVEIKHPGDRLTDEEIEKIAEQHLVAVHTTQARPTSTSEGEVMFPTYAFGESHERKPRNTIHFALNHPVESHISGDFQNRPYTIIAPVDGLARLNGSPAVLYGVDTYFAVNPGEAVTLPENTTVLEMSSQEDIPGIEVTGNTIQLKANALTSEDAQEISTYLLSRYKTELEPSYYTEDVEKQTRSNLIGMLTQTTPLIEVVSGISPEGQDDRPETFASQEQADYYAAMDAMHELLNDTLVKDGKNPDITEFTALPLTDSRLQDQIISSAIERLYTEDGLMERYPTLHPRLSEAMRQTIVRLETQRLGGESVLSDSQSAYIQTKGFDERVNGLGKALGIPGGLHAYQPERAFEVEYFEALRKARKQESATEQDSAKATPDFDWEEYSRAAHRSIWGALRGVSPPSRRMAIAMGIPTHARPSKALKGNSLPGAYAFPG